MMTVGGGCKKEMTEVGGGAEPLTDTDSSVAVIVQFLWWHAGVSLALCQCSEFWTVDLADGGGSGGG